MGEQRARVYMGPKEWIGIIGVILAVGGVAASLTMFSMKSVVTAATKETDIQVALNRDQVEILRQALGDTNLKLERILDALSTQATSTAMLREHAQDSGRHQTPDEKRAMFEPRFSAMESRMSEINTRLDRLFWLYEAQMNGAHKPRGNNP